MRKAKKHLHFHHPSRTANPAKRLPGPKAPKHPAKKLVSAPQTAKFLKYC